MRGRLVALVFTVVLPACGATGSGSVSSAPSHAAASERASAMASADPSSETTSGPVDIGGRSLFLDCQGSGSPTVVLEAGLTGDHRTWEHVQPAVAESARVCAYDRANVPPSDPAPGPRSASDSVADLHELLETAGIERPVVLVGFSMGGLISQLYARTYPEEVAGLVLVESNHPDEANQFNAHLTPEQIEEDRAFVLDNSESFDPFLSFEEAQAAGPMPEVPLIVITADAPGDWPPDWDAELFDQLRADQQDDLAGMVSGGRQVFAEDSGHHVPNDDPSVVIEAIESVLADLAGA